MLSFLKSSFRRALQARGYELYCRPWLPRGTDPWETMREFFPQWRPKTIFDVGANVGEVSLALAQYFPTAHIHAFEPVSATQQTLRRNLNAHPRITPHALAFGARAANIDIQLQKESTLNSLQVALNRDPSVPTETIEVATLDQFCVDHSITRIDLLKSDTEGHELAVLAGAARLLEAGAIDALLIEAGLTRDLPRFTPLNELVDLLRARGYVLIGIFNQSGWTHQRAAEFCNALFVRQALLSR